MLRRLLYFIIKSLISLDKLVARKFYYRMRLCKNRIIDLVITKFVQISIAGIFIVISLFVSFYYHNAAWISISSFIFWVIFFMVTGIIKDKCLKYYKKAYGHKNPKSAKLK